MNRGKGAALRAGFDLALKKGAAAVLTIDSDGQHDAAFAPAIVGALDRADIVIGTRDLSGKAVPKHRRIANMISSAATRKGTFERCATASQQQKPWPWSGSQGDRCETGAARAARAGFTAVNAYLHNLWLAEHFRSFGTRGW